MQCLRGQVGPGGSPHGNHTQAVTGSGRRRGQEREGTTPQNKDATGPLLEVKRRGRCSWGQRRLADGAWVEVVYDLTSTYRVTTSFAGDDRYNDLYVAFAPFASRASLLAYRLHLRAVDPTYRNLVGVTVTTAEGVAASEIVADLEVPKVDEAEDDNTVSISGDNDARVSDKQDSTRTYIIVGAVGAALVLVAALWVLYLWRRRKAVVAEGEAGGCDALSGTVPQAASPAVTALVHIVAPAGRLGVVIDVSPGGGPSCVFEVKATSPLRGEICLGDRIIAVDDKDVQRRTPTELSTLLREKQGNKTRKITVLRDVNPGGWRGKATPLVDVVAPAGPIGVVIDLPPGGGPSCICELESTSPLRGELRLGDRIVAVDDEDVQRRTPAEVSTLLEEKQANNSRKITVIRGLESGTRHRGADAGLTERRGGAHEETTHKEETPVVATKVTVVGEMEVGAWYSGADPRADMSQKEKRGRCVREELTTTPVKPEESSGVLPSVAVSLKPQAETPSSQPQKCRLNAVVPPGKLGIILATPTSPGPAYIHNIRSDAPLSLRSDLKLGDEVIAVDDEDVQTLSATVISNLLASKSVKERKITVLRCSGGEMSQKSGNWLDDCGGSSNASAEDTSTPPPSKKTTSTAEDTPYRRASACSAAVATADTTGHAPPKSLNGVLPPQSRAAFVELSRQRLVKSKSRSVASSSSRSQLLSRTNKDGTQKK